MSAPMIMVLSAFAMLALVLLIDMGGIIARRGKEIEYLRKRVKDDWDELAALRKALGFGPNSPVCFNGDKQGRMMLVTPPLVRDYQKAKNRIAQLDKDLCKFGCSLTDCRRRIMIWEDAPETSEARND